MLRLLDDGRVDAAYDDSFFLRRAAEEGHAAIVKRLLADPRVDPAASDASALRAARKLGHAAVAQQLLSDPRVDPPIYERIDRVPDPHYWDRIPENPRYESGNYEAPLVKRSGLCGTSSGRWSTRIRP